MSPGGAWTESKEARGEKERTTSIECRRDLYSPVPVPVPVPAAAAARPRLSKGNGGGGKCGWVDDEGRDSVPGSTRCPLITCLHLFLQDSSNVDSSSYC